MCELAAVEVDVPAQVEDEAAASDGERQRADVEEHAVERRAPSAPLHGDRRDREREGGARAEERGAGERADGADRDRAAVVDLERERLADADERDEREQPDDVVPTSQKTTPTTPAAIPATLTSADEDARAAARADRKRGPLQRVRRAGAAGSGCGPARRARRGAARDVLALLRHCGEAGRPRRRASSSGSELASRTRLRPWSLAR